MSLGTRLAVLERNAGPAGDCPVCRGEPPWGVRYDGQPSSGDPCPGCGELRVIEVHYVETGALRGSASAAGRARDTGGER
jgi:hypothetical protein